MKPSYVFSLSVLYAGLAISLAPARAQDASNPPAPPPAPATPDAVPPPAPATQDSTPADGQAPTPPPHRRHMHPGFVLGELTVKLSLTPEQQKTVGAFIVDSDGQFKAVREDDSIDREEKRAKITTIIEATRAQIRAALTPAQQAIFDTLPAHGERGRNAPSPTPAPTT